MHTKKNKRTPGRNPLLKNFSKGFTLLEVVIVIAIFGILSMIAYPTLSKWVPNYKLKAAARQLHGDMQKAKLHAVKTNDDVVFSFTVVNPCPAAGGGSYTFTDAGGATVATNILENGLCISASSFTNGSSGFNSRGLPAGITGTVTLTHNKLSGRTHTISQSSAGNLRIQ